MAELSLTGPGLVSLTYRKSSDSRKPILAELRLTDRDGDGYFVALDEHMLTRLLSGSVVEVLIVKGGDAP